MQRYILNNETKSFYKEDLHHIKNVMRFKSGSEVILCLDGVCHLSELDINDSVNYTLKERLKEEGSLDITIVQGNLKGSKLDDFIKYATIFGAKEIIITDFKRSVAKISNETNKLNRYFKIAKEAAELSHRNLIPNIKFAKTIKNINYNNYDLLLLADEEEKEVKIKDLNYKNNFKILVVVGPEGGIDKTEREYLLANGFTKITYGNFIYPAEIAAISALITLNTKYF